MKRLLAFFSMFLLFVLMHSPVNALTIDQAGNLLNNGSFETGSFDIVTGHNVASAANHWRQWSNSGTTLTTELINESGMQSLAGTGIKDGGAAFRITTGGGWDGAYTYNTYHTPAWDPYETLTFSAWVYTLSGEMNLLNGSNLNGFSRSSSSTIGQWEFLAVTVLGVQLNNEPLLYSVNGAADFIVDSAWLNYGATVQHPGAPVPEPTTMLLFGTGLIGLAGFRRKFKK